MLRANLVQPGQFRIEDVPLPDIKENEVLIKVKVCGICGSDIHAYYGKHPFISCPVVPGHEFSGVIEEIRANAAGKWQKGDRVIVEPSLVCGKCYNCRHDRYNICNELKVMGCQSDGAFSEYIAVPEQKVIKLDPKLTFEEGAMVEPLAVGVHAAEKARLKAGQTAVVIGAGTIGLMVLQAAKAMGAGVIVADVIDGRLDMAGQLGADHTINVSREPLDTAVNRLLPDGPDVILECVGAANTVNAAIHTARKGGRIVIVGVSSGDIPLPLGLIQDRELELVGDLMYMRPDFIKAQQLVAEERVKLRPLLSKTFKLKEVVEAFNYIETNKENAFKVLLLVN
ncbi:alcohol dehydrogenase [Desulfocucumis palustris]|uniref:Alcohol dehydrogenase n=1 Tax=Desulfocucumis palustris TaxID=1898651 RepID=A0A2L2XD55_9FIRM|nr:alcohol dehydrogenase catalytic domain-containing protein [Desulfocucumis palustris]GBF34279.1 alcohol dehydrogenase [Desulfocucumis palustris]